MEETDILERLVPGARFTLRDERGVFVCKQVRGTYVLAFGPQGEWRTPSVTLVTMVLPNP